MKGIMRRRLLTLLSVAGLASSAAPAGAQVPKGPEQGEQTKTETKIKFNKAKQENDAAATAAAKKERKAGGEQQATKDVVNEKVGSDQIVHKHIAGTKYEKSAQADAASKDAAKMTKASSENAAAKDVVSEKDRKGQQEALTVKQKVGEPNAATIKMNKSAAETDASKKATSIKGEKSAAGAKHVDQASPK